jgi:hypothetical protein
MEEATKVASSLEVKDAPFGQSKSLDFPAPSFGLWLVIGHQM